MCFSHDGGGGVVMGPYLHLLHLPLSRRLSETFPKKKEKSIKVNGFVTLLEKKDTKDSYTPGNRRSNANKPSENANFFTNKF